MSTLQDSDLFIVDRNGTNYQLPNSQMSTIQDTDLFVVERDGVNYKVEAKDVSPGPTGSIDIPVAVLTPLNGAGTNAGQPYKPLSTAITAVGEGGDVVYATDTIASVETFLMSGLTYTSGTTASQPVGDIFGGGNVTNNIYQTGKGSGFYFGASEFLNCKIGDVVTLVGQCNQGPPYTEAKAYLTVGGVDYETGMPNGSPTAPYEKSVDVTITSPGAIEIYWSNWPAAGIGNYGDCSLSQIYINGVHIYNGQVAPTKTLTFPTSNNFDKFEVGDVVQSPWNQSQVWSGGVTTPSGVAFQTSNNVTNIFDGNTNTVGQIDASTVSNAAENSFTVNLSSIGSFNSSIEVWANNAGVTAYINGESGNTFSLTDSVAGYQTLSFSPGALTSLTLQRNSTTGGLACTAIKVDGNLLADPSVSDPNGVSVTAIDAAGPTITVDGGSWYGADGTGDAGDPDWYQPSQEFSTGTFEGSWQPGYPKAQLFNGDITSQAAINGNVDCTYVLPFPLTEVTKVEVKMGYDGKQSAGVNSKTKASINSLDFNTIYSGPAITLSSVTFLTTNSGVSVFAIKVNDKLLVDSSIPGGNGATDITKSVSSQATLTFADDTELANMVGPLSQVDENGDVKTPVTSEIANVGTGGPTFFKPVLYTGNGTSQSITGVGFSPDMVWIKERTVSRDHRLADTLNGAGKDLRTSRNIAIVNDPTGLTAFDSDGFSVGTNTGYNESGKDYVAWCFDAGKDITVVNNEGSLPSQVRSNGDFSIITVENFTNEKDFDSFGHGLSSTPKFIIGKNIGQTQSWPVYHEDVGTGKFFYLDSSAASSGAMGGNYYNQLPTDSLIKFRANAATNKYVFYAWAETPGVSSFGSYVGNGQSGSFGPTISCGFQPAFLLIKNTSSSGDWIIFDTATSGAVGIFSKYLRANLADQETSGSIYIRTQKNGFNIDVTDAFINKSGDTFVYAAFADISGFTELTFEEPNEDLKYFQPGDNVGTESGFAPVLYTGNGSSQSITGVGFSPDLVWIKHRTDSNYWHDLFDTVRGPQKSLTPNNTGSERQNATWLTSFDADGFTLSSGADVNGSSSSYIAWCWDAGDTTVTNNDGSIESQVRSNGNFSVITADGLTQYTNAEIGHGLSKEPDFVIAKNRAQSSQWDIYHKDVGTGKIFRFTSAGASNATQGVDSFYSIAPTSSIINFTPNGATSNYVFYAWAETPGVSSFGEYTGNTSNKQIECGFKPAFVMIKATNLARSWQIIDSSRGGSQSLSPDTVDQEATNSPAWIEFQETGFIIKPTNNNINGPYNYIYAAFAGSNPIEVVDVDVANNTMTVDGGDWFVPGSWNQSQEWSDGTTTGVRSDSSIDNLFDGNPTTFVVAETVAGANWTHTASTNITANSSIEFVATSDIGTYFVGSDDNFVGATSQGSNVWSFPNLTYPFTFNQLRGVRTVDTNDGSGVYQVIVDGKPLVDASVTPTGETKVTGTPLIASANDVEYLDGNTLGVNGVSGTWLAGLHAQGAEVTASAPSPESIQYTSANGDPLTTPFTGTDATLTTRTWTWEVSNAVTGPWSDFAVRVDVPGQDGAVPLADRPTLEPNKFYQVKVRYDSNNAEYVESTFNTFKTGDN